MNSQEEKQKCSACGGTTCVAEYVYRDGPAVTIWLCSKCYWAGHDPLLSPDNARD